MHKNFLVIKGMTLMGEGGLKFKRFALKNTTQVEPFLVGMSNLLGTSSRSRCCSWMWPRNSSSMTESDLSLGDSYWVGLPPDQPALKPDPVLGYRCAD